MLDFGVEGDVEAGVDGVDYATFEGYDVGSGSCAAGVDDNERL